MTTGTRHAGGDVTHRVYEQTFDEDATATDDQPESTCPECDGTVVTNTAETVCTDCGLVLTAQPVDRGPQWGHDDDPEASSRRTGAPRTVTRHDDGLSTKIGRHTDGKGQSLSGRKRRQLGRLRREHRRAQFRSKAERNLAHGLSEIRRLTDRIECSRAIRNRTCILFRRAHGDGLCRGRSIEMLASGACYVACRERAELRTLDEIAAASPCECSQVRHGYQVLQAEYDLATPPYPIRVHVARLVSQLELAPMAAERALELADIAKETVLTTGCSRAGVAAACVYMATQDHPPARTQATCAEAADITPVTLRKRKEDLEMELDLTDEDASGDVPASDVS